MVRLKTNDKTNENETDGNRGINNNTDFAKVKMIILKQIAIHLFTDP